MSVPTDMAAFVRAVEKGGFSSAARELGLTPSAISKLVTRMEDRLGVRLLNRTTRRLALTRRRGVLPSRAANPRRHRGGGERGGALPRAPRGEAARERGHGLRRAPARAGAAGIPRALPEIEVEIEMTDRIVDLMEEGGTWGCGPATSRTPRSSRARSATWSGSSAPLPPIWPGTARREARGPARHNCLVFTGAPQLRRWPRYFRRRARRRGSGNLSASSAETLLQLALMGAGSPARRRDRGRPRREGPSRVRARRGASRRAAAAARGVPARPPRRRAWRRR